MKWHLDPKVPLGLLFLVMLTFGASQYRAGIHAEKIQKLEDQVKAGQLPTADKRLSLIEFRLLSIEKKLDDLIFPVPYPLDN